MEEVWRDGERTVREVLGTLNASSDRERAYTTTAAFVAAADGLLAALGDATVLRSDDGVAWRVRARP